jgi:hypothetical protein
MIWNKRHLPISFLPIILVPFILLGPILFTGKALYWGTPILQFIPWRDLAWTILRQGYLPLWNPLNGLGAPLLANYQVAVFYPATWFLILLDALGGVGWMAWGQTLVVIFHLVWAGIGMVYLTRRLNLNELAQSIAGLAFSLSGYLVARAGFLSINTSVAWLPWIVLAGTNLCQIRQEKTEPTRKFPVRNLILLVLFLTLQLFAGHAQTSFYTLIFLGAWMAFWGWNHNKVSGILRSSGLWVSATVLAFLLSAIQLIPTAEYLMQSQRASAVNYETAVNYSFFPLRILTLFISDLFGNPGRGGGYLLNVDNYWEDAVYIGFIPICFAVIWVIKAIFIRKENQDQEKDSSLASMKKLTIFLISVVFISFLFALGKYTPIFPFFYHFVPGFDLFQAPTRFMILAEISLVLLAAIGIHQWKKPEGKAREWTRRGIALSIAILIGAGIGLIILEGIQLIFVRAFAFTGLWGISVGVLSLNFPVESQKWKRIWSALLILIVCADLLITDWGLNPGLSTQIYDKYPAIAAKLDSLSGGHRIYLGASDESSLKFDQFFQFNNFNIPLNLDTFASSLLPNTNLLAGQSSANNFDPVLPGRYVRWMDYLEQADSRIKNLMLSLMDVKIIEKLDENSTRGVAYQIISNSNRLWWSDCAVAAVDEEDAWEKTLDLMSLQEETNPELISIVVEGTEPADDRLCGQTINETHSEVVSEDPNQLIIRNTNLSGGWLMISNTWYPGWKAFLDGVEIPIYRADFLFMAVEIPSGEHDLTLKYQPFSFYLGMEISLGTLFLGLLGLIIQYNRKKYNY